jgi:predicted branched-subunit amino acid permease
MATAGSTGPPKTQDLPSGYGAGARAVLPLAVVVGIVGIWFGVLATSAGLSPAASVTMSATTFAGSAQFAAVSILGAGGGVAVAVGSAAVLNVRYAVMGAALAPVLRGRWWKRLLVAQLAVDESWAVAYVGEGRFDPQRLMGAGLVLFGVHVAATAMGAFGGRLLGDPNVWGLDAAFPALFLVLLCPHVQDRKGRVAAMAGAITALALVPFAPPGIPVLAAAASAAAWGRR